MNTFKCLEHQGKSKTCNVPFTLLQTFHKLLGLLTVLMSKYNHQQYHKTTIYNQVICIPTAGTGHHIEKYIYSDGMCTSCTKETLTSTRMDGITLSNAPCTSRKAQTVDE